MSSHKPKSHIKNVLSVCLGILITGAALTYALWGVDFGELSRVFGDLRYTAALPFLCLLVIFFWLKAIRWAVILSPIGNFTSQQVTPAMMIGFGANNILPARLGELIRTVAFARRFRKSYSGVFATVALERVLDAGAILFYYVIAASIVGDLPAAVNIGAIIGLALIVISILIIVLMLSRLSVILSIWGRLSTRLPERIRRLGGNILHNVTVALSSLRTLRIVSLLIMNSLCQWGIMACTVWIALWAFGETISIGAAFFVMVATALAVSVPSVPGYVGPIQAAFVFALHPLGIAQETAFASSVFFLVAQWVPVTSAGILFFIFSGFKMTEVYQEAGRIERSPVIDEFQR